MSAERDVNRIVRSWLRTDEHESADAVLGIVLLRLDTTPQRRSLGPTGRVPMNMFAKLGVAAAATLAVVLAGSQLLPGQSTIGTPPASAAVLPTSTSAGASTPSPSVPTSKTVTVGDPFELPVQVTLPVTWTPVTQAAGQYDFQPAGEMFPYVGFFLVDGVYKDPCHPELGLRPGHALGPIDPHDVVDGFAAFPEGFETSERSSILTAGYRTEHIVLSTSIDPDAAGCTDAPVLQLFVARGEDVFTVTGTRVEFWALWVEATRLLLIAAETGPDGKSADQALIEEIVGSVEINP